MAEINRRKLKKGVHLEFQEAKGQDQGDALELSVRKHQGGGCVSKAKRHWTADSTRGEGGKEGFSPLVAGPRVDVTCFRAG